MTQYYLGLLSGTSMDAIDCALVSLSDSSAKLLANHSHPIPPELRNATQQLLTSSTNTLSQLGELDSKLGDLFATAVNTLLTREKIDKETLIAIGSHGQTLCHQPDSSTPYTLQIGDPNRIAEQTGITTVADFRRRDLVVNGQGAPLTPLFHQFLFHSTTENRLVVNLGGFTNLTYLPADPKQTVCGFDTGPANILLDAWCQHHLQQLYDKAGAWAKTGTINSDLLGELLSHPFLQIKPPKSTGIEAFNLAWLLPKTTRLQPQDVQATLVEFTVYSLTQAIQQYCPAPARLILCGGGVHNDYLIDRLHKQLTNTAYTVTTSDTFNYDPDWLEAMAFAWFAKQTVEKKSVDLRAITGSTKPIVLGGIYL